MQTKPILFNTEMVRDILGGRKTQTRRVIKPQPEYNPFAEMWMWRGFACASGDNPGPYGQFVVGDRLWVRETWAINDVIPIEHRTKAPYIYRAELNDRGQIKYTEQWKPSIHMPRAASRITLEITGVKIEQLQDISEEDAIAEGVCELANREFSMNGGAFRSYEATNTFRQLWDSINAKKHPWQSNPWVWAIEFKRVAIAGESSQ